MSQNENNKEEKKEEKTYDLSSSKDIFTLFKSEEDPDKLFPYIISHITKTQNKYKLNDYNIVILYDENFSISNWHSNRIYEAISSANCEKDILLLIHSAGGQIEPAYLISKTCKRLAKEKFIVGIPRRAKSAATLIALGADEIHMGLMSELGPIDPQFENLPALGLSNALKSLAELCTQYPASSNMFAKYLSQTLDLRVLGYFERISESAAQYGEKLLLRQNFSNDRNAKSIANHFVYYYKDHGFVVDIDEAIGILGDNIIKKETVEYNFINEIYKFLDHVEFLYGYFFKKRMSYVGSIYKGIYLSEKKK